MKQSVFEEIVGTVVIEVPEAEESKRKHTPEPWYYKETSRKFSIAMGSALDDDAVGYLDGHLIESEHYLREGDEQYEEIQANFVLMAASPKLLRACDQALEAFEALSSEEGLSDEKRQQVIQTLTDAIAHATDVELAYG